MVLLGLSNAISLHAGRLDHGAVGLAMAGRASVGGIVGAESAGFAVCRRRRIIGETCAEFDQVRRSAAIRDLNWAAAGPANRQTESAAEVIAFGRCAD